MCLCIRRCLWVYIFFHFAIRNRLCSSYWGLCDCMHACMWVHVCMHACTWIALLLLEMTSFAVIGCMSLSFVHTMLLCISPPIRPIMESRKSGAEVEVQQRQGRGKTRVTSEGRLAIGSSGGGHQRVLHNHGFKRTVLDALEAKRTVLDALQTQTLDSRCSTACMAVPLSPRGHSLTFKWSFYILVCGNF